MEWNMRDHHFEKPKTTDGYFEKMSMIVFSTGLNWNVIKAKWDDIKKAFDNFKVDKVAKFTNDDIDRLLNDPKVIRSGGKINAVINNARATKELEKEFGSFPEYFKTMKKEGLPILLKDLKKRFSYMRDSTSIMFLYGCGEESPELAKLIQKSHNK